MLDKSYFLPEDAVQLILQKINFRCLSSETILIELAYGRVTYEDIIAPEDLPGFTRSSVDGFAVKSSDTFGAKDTSPQYLTLVGEIAMGEIPQFSISSGQAAAVSTGGMLPEGADAIVMLEHVNIISKDLIEVLRAVSPGENIIFKDEDVRRGEVVISAGHKLKPQDIGALAGLGFTEIKVVRKPKVSVILTGDEIIPHTEPIVVGKVRDINSFTLKGLIIQSGAEAINMGIVRDDYSEIKRLVNEAYENSDIILITGGTSAGIKDLTAKIIDELGNPGVLFHGASIKPGKPIIGGICNGKPVFGLPGHPVAVYICFELFVKPVIEKMIGFTGKNLKKLVKAKLTKSIPSQAGREDFIRVSLEEKDRQLFATPLLSKSGLIMSLVKADGILRIPASMLGFEEGQEVTVELID